MTSISATLDSDVCTIHLMKLIKKSKDILIDLSIIPRGTASQLEVLDKVVKKPCKNPLIKQYSKWVLYT